MVVMSRGRAGSVVCSLEGQIWGIDLELGTDFRCDDRVWVASHSWAAARAQERESVVMLACMGLDVLLVCYHAILKLYGGDIRIVSSLESLQSDSAAFSSEAPDVDLKAEPSRIYGCSSDIVADKGRNYRISMYGTYVLSPRRSMISGFAHAIVAPKRSERR